MSEKDKRPNILLKVPKSWGMPQGKPDDHLVELMDVMPTLLDSAGVDIPDSVDGRSVLPLMRGDTDGWHTHLHGECACIETMNSGMQYIVEARWKYVYYPGTGLEHLFDLEADPREMTNLAADPAYRGERDRVRALLADELDGRPEGFVDNGELVVLGGPTANYMPGFGRPSDTGTRNEDLLKR